MHVERAEMAAQSGDEETRQRSLLEARQRSLLEADHQFTEIGATGHAERPAGELALPAS